MSDDEKVQAFATLKEIGEAAVSLQRFIRDAQMRWLADRQVSSGFTEKLACYVFFAAMTKALDPSVDGTVIDPRALATLRELIDAFQIRLGPAAESKPPALN